MSLPEGLFGCFNDFNTAVVGCFCPCYLVAKNQAEVDNRACTVCDCLCGLPEVEYFLRQRLRSEFGASYSACGDCLSLAVCPTCFICQNARLIKHKQQHTVNNVNSYVSTM
ncbi:hypothetical protein GEMRC1_008988 [Eukaryota sp. GEM-RC1]